MKADEKKVLKRYAKALKLVAFSVISGDTVHYVFTDKQGSVYTHSQVNPNTCNPRSSSKARQYLIHLCKAHNMQSDNKVNYTDLIPDATHNMEVGGYNMIGSYFLCDCSEKIVGGKYGNKVYYNAEYVMDMPPSKEAIEAIKKYEISDEYKFDVLKKRKEESQLEYANRMMQEYKTFYKETN